MSLWNQGAVARKSLGTTAIGYGMGDRDSIPFRGMDFSLHHSIQTDSRATLTSYSMGMGTGGSIFGDTKWRETDHSPPCSDEVRNSWSYTFTPPWYLEAMFKIEVQGQLYLVLPIVVVS
jgi:hypothetical protein